MKKSVVPLPPKGADEAAEVYLWVGISLSRWEAAEDSLMGLFRVLCEKREPTAYAAYVAAPRTPRAVMLRGAMDRYSKRFIEGEVKQVEEAMRALDKLASRRNEIAHGYCVHYSSASMVGHYLLPSFHEQVLIERDPRFAHTPTTMKQFSDAVTKLAVAVDDVRGAVMVREQEARLALAAAGRLTPEAADRVTLGERAQAEHPALQGHEAARREHEQEGER